MATYLPKQKFILVLFASIILAALSMAFVSKASAHGYVTSPESRAALCAKGVNKDCGAIVYEPQSLEGPGNFPSAGVPDGKIASAGGAFPKLDEQSADRWSKVAMKSGQNTFTWKITAAHATEKWDYYITKANWDPNKPLKRSDLELFCTVNDGGKRPPFELSHTCKVPERSGYHVILAYWEVFDTANAFYNVIDVNFDGSNPAPNPEPEVPVDPENPGDGPANWNASTVYLKGDRVTYNNAVYEAKWWTQNEIPGKADVWLLVSGSTSSSTGVDTGLYAWDSSRAYVNG